MGDGIALVSRIRRLKGRTGRIPRLALPFQQYIRLYFRVGHDRFEGRV